MKEKKTDKVVSLNKIASNEHDEQICNYLHHLEVCLEENNILGLCVINVKKGKNKPYELFISDFLQENPERLYMLLDDLKEELRNPEMEDCNPENHPNNFHDDTE